MFPLLTVQIMFSVFAVIATAIATPSALNADSNWPANALSSVCGSERTSTNAGGTDSWNRYRISVDSGINNKSGGEYSRWALGHFTPVLLERQVVNA